MDFKPKYFTFSVNCEWEEFTEWTHCNQTCGGGMQERIREKRMESKYDGLDCEGDAIEERECNTQECPGKMYFESFEQ